MPALSYPPSWPDFSRFVGLQLQTEDYDAHIPFLSGLCARLRATDEAAAWIGLLYMTYYSEGSMWAAYAVPGVRTRQASPPLTLPITTQRRNLYGGRIGQHVLDLMAVRPNLMDWLCAGSAGTWPGLLATLGTVWGNGRWACYTTAELLTRLCRRLGALVPDTYEIMDSTGPKRGLAALGFKPSETAAECVRRLLEKDGHAVSYSILESLLCDWGGMCKGTFYSGRNIDRQQGRITDAARVAPAVDMGELWRTRAAVYPAWSLGEGNDWHGIDRKRLKAYKERGVVLAPHEER